VPASVEGVGTNVSMASGSPFFLQGGTIRSRA